MPLKDASEGAECAQLSGVGQNLPFLAPGSHATQEVLGLQALVHSSRMAGQGLRGVHLFLQGRGSMIV